MNSLVVYTGYKPLENDKIQIKTYLLETCRIYGNSDLNKDFLSLESKLIKIFIKTFNKETYQLEIDYRINVKELKEIIYDRIGLPIDNQCLNFNDKLHLNDKKRIKYYDIEEGSLLELLPIFKKPIQLFIINEDIQIPIDASIECKIKYLKLFIKFRTKIPLNKQRLIYQGNNLNDDNKLDYYNIDNISYIYLKIID